MEGLIVANLINYAVHAVETNYGAPFKQAEFDILYGKGTYREGSLIDMGVEHGFIRKSGAEFVYGD